MGKIIINSECIDDSSALTYVLKVILQGKISNEGTQYCYITQFESGHKVYADKTKSGTYTFRVWKE